MAFDSDDNLFVSEGFPNQRILKFTTDGTQSTFASGLRDPNGLAFDTAGNLFVAEEGSGNILKFTPSGVQNVFATVVQPVDLAFDSAGNLFVSDSNGGRLDNTGFIYKFTPDGTRTVFASGLDPTFLTFQPVPEPSSFAFSVLGFVGLIAVQRRTPYRAVVNIFSAMS